MAMYNPSEAAKKDNPEQQIITAARRVEYDRQFKRAAEDKLNQENPTPENTFKVQAQSIARKIVEGANNLVNKKGKGEISNADFAADMGMVNQMVDNLGNFTTNVEESLAAYKEMLLQGTLSYGMDQHDEAVLQAIDKGEVKLALDKDGRVKMEGKANHAMKGLFDVNIYDFYNVPEPIKKLKPINNLLKPFVDKLGVDENGMPLMKVDKYGNMVYDTGDLEEHRADILEFTGNAIAEAGPEGIRSYLGDHLNLPSEEIKALAENINYTDENGNNWSNQADAVAHGSMKDFVGGQYRRQVRPHPDTIASNASKAAAEIATDKQVPLINPDPKAAQETQMQQTEVMQTPQGEVAETTTEDVIGPISSSLQQPVQAQPEEEVAEEVVEETPLKMKTLSAKDLIKKYS
tara:strand:+ start:979 stop:2193 length:1215 start_codon:yes stop_codon:yes gene_type:complete